MPARIFPRFMLLGLLIGFGAATVLAAEAPLSSSASAGVAATDPMQTVTIHKTFNNVPFDYQIKFHSQRNGYKIYDIKYPSSLTTPVEQNNTVPAEYYLPDSITSGDCPDFRAVKMGLSPSTPRPAVICLHILDGNDVLTDMVCSVLAMRGIPAIMFKLPYYGERGLPDGPEALAKDPQLFAGALAQAGEDLRRTIDVLASRKEIDPDQISITGISLGGIVAASAAGKEPRINRAAFVLAGGDLLKIIHHARETQPLSKMIKELPPAERRALEDKIMDVDPLRFAPALGEKSRQGKLMMINAAEDEVIPRASTEKLATALGVGDRVIWLQNLGHYTSMAELPRILQTLADFFAQDLPPGTTPRPITKRQTSPMDVLAELMQQVAVVLDDKPGPGKCHLIDLEIKILPKDQNSPLPAAESQLYQNSPLPLGATTGAAPEGEGIKECHFRLVRGSQGKFAIFLKISGVGEISLGQNDHPWIAYGNKEIIEGTENPGPALKDPLEFFNKKQKALLCMLAGLLNSVMIEPDVLEHLLAVEDRGMIDGARVFRITARGKISATLELALKAEGNTPQTLTFDVAEVNGKVKFLAWQINTVAQDAMFQPPPNLPRHAVDEENLYSMFSTWMNFAFSVE
jgi:dienelactone hydrolase